MMVINQKPVFETKMTTSGEFGQPCLPSVVNDSLEIPMHSACQRARCASGGEGGEERCTQTVKSKGNQNSAWLADQSVNEDL